MFLHIDWTTLVFQIINFLVLVAILSRFLFRPVLRIIEQRRQEVQSRLDDAAREQAEGKLLKEQYEAGVASADKQRSELMEQAKKDAEREREKTIQDAEEYVKNRKEQAERHIDQETKRSLVDMRNQITQTALHLSDRMLSEIANSDLNQSCMDRFLGVLRGMDTDKKERLRIASKEGVVIVSAYPLIAHQKEELADLLGAETISYQEDSGLLAGASIRAGDICLDGSLKGQLDEIRARMESEQREASS